MQFHFSGRRESFYLQIPAHASGTEPMCICGCGWVHACIHVGVNLVCAVYCYVSNIFFPSETAAQWVWPLTLWRLALASLTSLPSVSPWEKMFMSTLVLRPSDILARSRQSVFSVGGRRRGGLQGRLWWGWGGMGWGLCFCPGYGGLMLHASSIFQCTISQLCWHASFSDSRVFKYG